MKQNESIDWENAPGAEELSRLTSRDGRGDFGASASRDAFLALGEAAESAAKDFDWQKIAAKLTREIELTSRDVQVNLPPRAVRTRSGALAWVSVCSAAVLLAGLVVGILAQPEAREKFAEGKPSETTFAGGIDSWDRAPLEGELAAAWGDELDAELAATRRALKQGRDPWIGDEPALSNVFAQVNDLSAGLLLESF